MSRGLPSGPTTNHSTPVPWYLALRASSEYSGSGVSSARGADTPLPTRNAPPPIPPPCPGPTPGPDPEPTPPPLPDPMPPPLHVPFDGGPSGMFDIGSPRFGILLASLISGGTTTVGSTANLGLSLRITTAGGASCCMESLGSFPLVAASLSRSPPPPPPPIALPFLLVIGRSRGAAGDGGGEKVLSLGFFFFSD